MSRATPPRSVRRGSAARSIGPLLVAVVAVLLVPNGLTDGKRVERPPVPVTPALPHPAPVIPRGEVRVLDRTALPGLRGSGAHLASAGAYNWITGWWVYSGGFPPDDLINGEGGAFLVDDRSNNQTIFGGLASGGLSNVTVEFNDTPYNWSGVEFELANGPSSRANMSYVSDDPLNVGVIFGGLTNLRTQSVSNETWAFDFPSRSWVNETSGTAPSPRENAAMASDPSAGIALLEGGVDPSFRSGGSTGRALWNDTWELNLTSWNWTRLSVSDAPPPMMGSSMIYDPIDGRFYLFGGCGETCTASVWSYRPGDSRWSIVNTSGYALPARASAALEWDPTQGDATLFGGFAPGPNGPVAFDDTVVFDAQTARWTRQPVDQPPPSLYDLTVAEPEMNGCEGMWVLSGSNALNGLPPFTWLLQSPGAPYINCFIPQLPNGSNSPPPPCPNATTALSIAVDDSATSLPIVGATVSFAGPCSPGIVTTDANGTAQVEVGPGIAWNVTFTHQGYYTRTVSYAAPPTPSALLRVLLKDLPFATISCYALGANPPATPLADVTVTLDGSVILGTCGPTGKLGPLQLPFAGGTLTFTGVRAGYSGANDSVVTPPDANVSANLTLRPSGPLELEIVRATDGTGMVGAIGTLTSLDPLSVAPIPFVTGVGGWFNVTVGAANFTVTVRASGLATTTTAPLYHPWAASTRWWIPMGGPWGSNLTVLLLDAQSRGPIAGGTVSVAPNASATTGTDGVAQFEGLGPPGPAEVVGSAPGYVSASTLVVLSAHGTLPTLRLSLARTPACGPAATCALSTNGTPVPGFHLLPGGGWTLTLLVGSPVALLATAVGALIARRIWRTSARPHAS